MTGTEDLGAVGSESPEDWFRRLLETQERINQMGGRELHRQWQLEAQQQEAIKAAREKPDLWQHLSFTIGALGNATVEFLGDAAAFARSRLGGLTLEAALDPEQEQQRTAEDVSAIREAASSVDYRALLPAVSRAIFQGEDLEEAYAAEQQDVLEHEQTIMGKAEQTGAEVVQAFVFGLEGAAFKAGTKAMTQQVAKGLGERAIRSGEFASRTVERLIPGKVAPKVAGKAAEILHRGIPGTVAASTVFGGLQVLHQDPEAEEALQVAFTAAVHFAPVMMLSGLGMATGGAITRSTGSKVLGLLTAKEIEAAGFTWLEFLQNKPAMEALLRGDADAWREAGERLLVNSIWLNGLAFGGLRNVLPRLREMAPRSSEKPQEALEHMGWREQESGWRSLEGAPDHRYRETPEGIEISKALAEQIGVEPGLRPAEEAWPALLWGTRANHLESGELPGKEYLPDGTRFIETPEGVRQVAWRWGRVVERDAVEAAEWRDSDVVPRPAEPVAPEQAQLAEMLQQWAVSAEGLSPRARATLALAADVVGTRSPELSMQEALQGLFEGRIADIVESASPQAIERLAGEVADIFVSKGLEPALRDMEVESGQAKLQRQVELQRQEGEAGAAAEGRQREEVERQAGDVGVPAAKPEPAAEAARPQEVGGERAQEAEALRQEGDRPGRTEEEGVADLREVDRPEAAPETLPRQALIEEAVKLGVTNAGNMSTERLVAEVNSRVERPGERGAADVDAVVDVVKTLVRGGGETIKQLSDLWSKPLIDQVKSYGTPEALKMARSAREAVDEAKRWQGEFSEDLAEWQHMTAGWSPVPGKRGAQSRKYSSAVRELEQDIWDKEVPFFSETRMQLAVERKLPEGETISPRAEEIVTFYDNLRLTTGQPFADAGYKIRVRNPDGSTEWIPITVDETRHRFLRRMSPEGIDILRRGPGDPAFDKLAEGLQKWHQLSEGETTKRLKELANVALYRRDATEIARMFDRFPAAVKAGNRIYRILESHPFEAGTSMLEHAARRLGYLKAFGQDLSGKEIEAQVSQFAEGTGVRTDAVNLLRALSGMPVENPWFKPGGSANMLMRWFRSVDSLWRAQMLTKAWIPNISEPFGNAMAYAGYQRAARALWNLRKETGSAEDIYAELGRQRAITRDIARWGIQSGRVPESVARLAGGVFRLPAKLVNEWNDAYAGLMAREMVRDWEAGRSTATDRSVLRMMQFDDAQITAMLNGRGDKLYDRFVSNFADFTQASGAHPAERPRAYHNRVFRSWFAFQQYAMMKWARTMETNRELYHLLREGGNKRAAGTLFLRYYGGSVFSGASASAMRALVGYGIYGLLDEIYGAFRSPEGFVEFTVDSGQYAIAGGMVDAVGTSMTEAQNVWQKLSSFSPAASRIEDFIQMLNGVGSYRDMSGAERLGKFLTQPVAASQEIRRLGALVGLADADNKMERALSRYYKWRRDRAPLGSFASQDFSEFRRHMKAAVRLVERGVDPMDPKVAEHIVMAAGQRKTDEGEPDWTRVRASLRARRIMAGPEWKKLTPEQIKDLATYLGADNWQMLRAHDTLLENMALRAR